VAELARLLEAILNGDTKTAVTVTTEALADGTEPAELVARYMIPAMDEVGQRFECEEYFVPELLLSARAMKGALDLLRPLLAASGVEPVGRVVIGTVKGDLHDIGKNLVASMLEGGGFDVLDLGADVPPERFIEAVRGSKADIVALSALLTVTMPAMKTTIEAIKRAGLRDQVKIMVGGAPVTRGFAVEIGADGYSENASTAVVLARTLVEGSRAGTAKSSGEIIEHNLEGSCSVG
jgi:5-methyltetrahydrofolate--homocysteine methyltransferase